MYSQKVMDHFENPRNVGTIDDADGIGMVTNQACGDTMKLYIKVEGERIVVAKFKTAGCGAAVATSSMVTEMLIGKTLEEALNISNKMVVEALDGLPVNKIHCSVLAEDAIKATIADYHAKGVRS